MPFWSAFWAPSFTHSIGSLLTTYGHRSHPDLLAEADGGMALPDVNLYHVTSHLTRVLNWCCHSQTVGAGGTGPVQGSTGLCALVPYRPANLGSHPFYFGWNLARILQSVPDFLYISDSFPTYPYSQEIRLHPWSTWLEISGFWKLMASFRPDISSLRSLGHQTANYGWFNLYGTFFLAKTTICSFPWLFTLLRSLQSSLYHIQTLVWIILHCTMRFFRLAIYLFLHHHHTNFHTFPNGSKN